MNKEFLALTLVFVLAAGFGAIAAEPAQTHPEKLSVGMQIESNSVRTSGVTLNVPMYGGSTRFYFGSGIVARGYGPYVQKDSLFSLSGVFYPGNLTWKENFKGSVLPSFLKLEKDYYRTRIGFGAKAFAKATKGEFFSWDFPDLYGGGYGVLAAELRVPLDITMLDFLKDWSMTTGYQMAPGIITEPPYLDVQNAVYLGLNYDF